MLSVALSGLVLICSFFKETYFCHLHAYLLACFYKMRLKFHTSNIYLDDCDKQYQFSSQEMGQICDLETVEPQEIPFKVCAMFYNALSDQLYQRCEEKNYFSCNHFVPIRVRFYTKPGSGQCQYLEQGTPDSYASLRIALYSHMSYSECPTTNNRISQSEISTSYRCAQLRIQILFQVGHLEQNILPYGVGHSD